MWTSGSSAHAALCLGQVVNDCSTRGLLVAGIYRGDHVTMACRMGVCRHRQSGDVGVGAVHHFENTRVDLDEQRIARRRNEFGVEVDVGARVRVDIARRQDALRRVERLA